MPTVSVITDGGGDYPSLAAAIAGEGGTTGDLIIQLSGINVDTAATNITGMAFSTLVVEGDPVRPAGRYNGTEFWSNSHYRMQVFASNDAITVDQANVTLRGFQVQKIDAAKICIVSRSGNFLCECMRVLNGTGGQPGVQINSGAGGRIEACIIQALERGIRARVTTEIVNCTLKECGTGVARDGSITKFYNNKFINCTTDYIGSGPDAGDKNATTKATGDIPEIDILSINTPDDYVSATDFRPKLGGKLFHSGSRANIPRPNDITGSPWEWANVSPFSEFVADTTVTVNTDNVGPPDYTSLAQASAGEGSTPGGLQIKCSGIAVDGAMGFSGMAYSRSLVRSDPDHVTGLYTGSEDWSTQHYRISSSGGTHTIFVQQDDTIIYNLQVEKAGSSNANALNISTSGQTCSADCNRIRVSGSGQQGGIVAAPVVSLNGNIINASIGTGTNKYGMSLWGDVIDISNNTIKGFNKAGDDGIEGTGATRTITNMFNNQSIDNTNDVDQISTTNSGKNATSKASSQPQFDIFSIATPADYVSATDFRSVDGGKLDLDGDAANLLLTDITGVPFVNVNVSPFNEIFISGPVPSGGYSYGYMVG